MSAGPRLAIIDYGSGNLRSVAKAFERVAAGKASVVITDAPAALADASHIVLPGVGAFGDCMKGLSGLAGMLAALEREVIARKKPFLGICVGMQMLFEKGHEHGVHEGLGWLKGEIVRIEPKDASLKVPHMGWNELQVKCDSALLKDIGTGDHAYFVHSYHACSNDSADVLATVSYGQTLTAVVGRDNIMGAQFHPEKSQATGLRLLHNFLEI